MEHLFIERLDIPEKERRKKSYYPPDIKKDHNIQGVQLINQFKDQEKFIKEKANTFKFSPYLITKVELEDNVSITEDLREKLDSIGLKIINQENKKFIILFTRDERKSEFYNALNNYKKGVVAKKHIIHQDIFKLFKDVSGWSHNDRIGFGLEDLKEEDYIDCYLWVFDSVQESQNKAEQFINNIKEKGVRICDKYITSSIVIVRIYGKRELLDYLLEHPLIYKIDAIQRYLFVSNTIKKYINKSIDDINFDNTKIDFENTPAICIVDSGIFKGHHLLKKVIGDSKTFYATASYKEYDNDLDGHGTKVASICEYGDFDPDKPFIPTIILYNAKIHDGMYIGNIDLCLEELKQEGFKLTYEQEEIIEEFFKEKIELNILEDKIGIKNRKNEFKSIVKKYSNIYDNLIPNQMKKIVQYFYTNYGCKIFNLSQGDPKYPYTDGKPRAWACVLDEIQNEIDVLFIVSSGNSKFRNFYNGEETDIISEYPKYFYTYEDCRIIDPANSVTSLTVGSLAINDIPYIHDIKKPTIIDIPITKRGQISSITRIGPGVNGSIKPDVVAYGGDNCINTLTKDIGTNAGLSKILFSNNLKEGLFSFDIGSSFAAPYVTHIAAKIKEKYNNFSSNLIKALIASSAEKPSQIEDLINDKLLHFEASKEKIHSNFLSKHKGNTNFDVKKLTYYLVGYGMPKLNNCLDTLEYRVVLYADTEITPNLIHIYEIPIPEVFINAKGTKKVTISLAFNPEVRKSRLDYMGTKMSFRLIRGKSFEEVNEVYSSQKGKNKEDKEELFESRFICNLGEPGTTLREKGTLQKGVFKFTKPQNYGEFYYLVVNCEKKWSEKIQNYAVVIILETEDKKARLFNIIKNKIRQREKVKPRIKTQI